MKRYFLALVSVLLFVFLIQNFLTPYLADDFGHLYAAKNADFLDRMWYLYTHNGGRALTSSYADGIFFKLPKLLFNFINTGVFTGFVWMIYRISRGEKRYSIPLLIFITVIMWTFTLSFGQVFLWPLGSMVYLWCIAGLLFFILPYYLSFSDAWTFKNKVIGCIAMVPLGIFAGFAGEAATMGGLFIVGALILPGLIKTKRIDLWKLVGILVAIASYLVVLLAPGNSAREGIAGQDDSLLSSLSYRFWGISNYVMDELKYFFLIYFLLIALHIYCSQGSPKRVILSIAFFIAGVVAIFAMLATLPYFYAGRAFLGGTVFLFIAAAISFSDIWSKGIPIAKALSLVIVLVLSFGMFLSLPRAMIDMARQQADSEERNRIVAAFVDKGIRDVVVPLIPTAKFPQTAAHKLENLKEDSDFWVNRGFALHKDLNSVACLPREEWVTFIKEQGIVVEERSFASVWRYLME
ncbi:MAG: DUF6056 family protein [Propionibacteriaceae bacterium]|nr:DUF6056 family protein [Propionibacteriaceae bacterium]